MYDNFQLITRGDQDDKEVNKGDNQVIKEVWSDQPACKEEVEELYNELKPKVNMEVVDKESPVCKEEVKELIIKFKPNSETESGRDVLVYTTPSAPSQPQEIVDKEGPVNVFR